MHRLAIDTVQVEGAVLAVLGSGSIGLRKYGRQASYLHVLIRIYMLLRICALPDLLLSRREKKDWAS